MKARKPYKLNNGSKVNFLEKPKYVLNLVEEEVEKAPEIPKKVIKPKKSRFQA
jgi:hypothetical protein